MSAFVKNKITNKTDLIGASNFNSIKQKCKAKNNGRTMLLRCNQVHTSRASVKGSTGVSYGRKVDQNAQI